MFRITKAVMLFFTFIIFSDSYSQDNVDSLKIAFKTSKHDTLRVKTVYNLLVNLSSRDKEYSYYLGQVKAMADKHLANGSASSKEKVFWQNAKGQYLVHKSQQAFESNRKASIELLDQAIQIFSDAKNRSAMADAMVSKGIVLRRLGRVPEAVESYYKGLKNFELAKDKAGIAYAQMSIAKVYNDQEKDDKALDLSVKALRYFESIPKPTMEDIYTKTELNHQIGEIYFSNKKYGVAEKYFQEGYKLAKQVNYTMVMSILLDKMGRINYENGKNDLAYQKYQEALQLDQPDLYKSNLYISIGELCIAEKKYAEAEQYLTKALAIGKKEGSLDIQMHAAKYLNYLYKSTKTYGKALSMFEMYTAFQDSIKVDASKNTIKEQQLQYDFEKKELNLKLTSEKKAAIKNNWLIGLSGAILVLLLGVYFYYRNNKQKHAIAGLEKNQIKQKLLITQMNPHFIFNSIDNIQGLIHDKKDGDAVNYLSKFSKLTRQILENSNENYISLSEEVEMIENYLSIQQLLYSNKFSYKIDVENEIDTEAILLPPMLTQPFIENAIKHGLANKDQNGMIEIHFYLNNAKLFFEVSDNGKGFDDSKKVNGHKSLAMTITKERLVNYTKNTNFVVQTDNILDKETNVVGAKVSFEIPYIYEK